MICEHGALPWPLPTDPPHVLVLETESAEPGDVAMDLPDDLDVVVAVDAADRARFWAYRERAGEAVTAFGLTHRFDVTVPQRSWDAFVADASARVQSLPAVEHVFSFGHLADGNVHFEVIGPAADDEHVDEVVLRCSPAEIATMRAVKSALDPAGLFNPGALFA